MPTGYWLLCSDIEAGAKAVYDTKSTSQGVNLEVGAKSYLVSLCDIYVVRKCILTLERDLL